MWICYINILDILILKYFLLYIWSSHILYFFVFCLVSLLPDICGSSAVSQILPFSLHSNHAFHHRIELDKSCIMIGKWGWGHMSHPCRHLFSYPPSLLPWTSSCLEPLMATSAHSYAVKIGAYVEHFLSLLLWLSHQCTCILSSKYLSKHLSWKWHSSIFYFAVLLFVLHIFIILSVGS